MDDLGYEIVKSLPSPDALGDLLAEYLGLVFGINAFDRIFGKCQRCGSLNDFLEGRLNPADHRRKETSRTIATPVLPHALQLFVAVWRLKVEFLLD
jgi:hypothetical protein